MYEVRNYVLKPGTMIEWGNNWARAISFRRENDEAFAGFFSQIGRLYNVHHIWGKKIKNYYSQLNHLKSFHKLNFLQHIQTFSHERKLVKQLGENRDGMNAWPILYP